MENRYAPEMAAGTALDNQSCNPRVVIRARTKIRSEAGRCHRPVPRCHQVAGTLYRSRLVWVDGVEYHLRCRSCHEKSYIRTRSSLVVLLTDALPASDAEDVLKERTE
jgi:hypothetical protein